MMCEVPYAECSQQLMMQQTAHLAAAPAGARTTLTALYQCIEARLANRQALTSLHGRLDLLAAQPQPGDSAAPVSTVLKPQVPLCCCRPRTEGGIRSHVLLQMLDMTGSRTAAELQRMVAPWHC